MDFMIGACDCDMHSVAGQSRKISLQALLECATVHASGQDGEGHITQRVFV
jgi:hypothetical protein